MGLGAMTATTVARVEATHVLICLSPHCPAACCGSRCLLELALTADVAVSLVIKAVRVPVVQMFE